jgi:hypothetical protein
MEKTSKVSTTLIPKRACWLVFQVKGSNKNIFLLYQRQIQIQIQIQTKHISYASN